MAYRRESYFAL